MYNDRYGLTDLALHGIKTMTRRDERNKRNEMFFKLLLDDEYKRFGGALHFDGIGTFKINFLSHNEVFKTRYKVGEVVAIAQNYQDAKVSKIHYQCINVLDHSTAYTKGLKNKMFVQSELMPHRIKITDIKLERLQNISLFDCLKEGIQTNHSHNQKYSYFDDLKKKERICSQFVRDSFELLINRINGQKYWDKNPFVVVYSFQVIK